MMLNERAEYVVSNGATYARTTDHGVHAYVGDTLRIYMAVG